MSWQNYERKWRDMFYLLMGFAAVWLFVTLYLVYMGLRQRQIEEEMRTLQEEIGARKKA